MHGFSSPVRHDVVFEKMKKDWTVELSGRILVGSLVGTMLLAIPDSLGYHIPAKEVLVHILAWPAFIAAIRLCVVLWFQTFHHAIRHKQGELRKLWVIAHILFGWAASWLYYDWNTKETQQSNALPSHSQPNQAQREPVS